MDGILGLWKEAGMTSHDCVFKLRKILHTKKIGHSGTLDPAVTGVLPICIGKGTKMVEYLQDSGKVYEGTVVIGFSTTTEDATGEVVATKLVESPLSEALIDEKMASFVGAITQIPPMYSAVKVNGKRLYEYARNNETVERPQRKAEIYSFERTSPVVFDAEKGLVSFDFKVACGKGTYVRTLAVDLGEALGYPSHMSVLKRTASGGLTKDQCYTLAEVAEKMEAGKIAEILQPIEYGVKDFPRIHLNFMTASRVKNGVVMEEKYLKGHQDAPVIALFYQGEVLSLYEKHPEKAGYYRPQKVFRTELKNGNSNVTPSI